MRDPGSHRTAEKADDGWVNLFNGKDLDGWEQHGGKAKYRAEGGEIIGSSVPNTAWTDWWTARSAKLPIQSKRSFNSLMSLSKWRSIAYFPLSHRT